MKLPTNDKTVREKNMNPENLLVIVSANGFLFCGVDTYGQGVFASNGFATRGCNTLFTPNRLG